MLTPRLAVLLLAVTVVAGSMASTHAEKLWAAPLMDDHGGGSTIPIPPPEPPEPVTPTADSTSPSSSEETEYHVLLEGLQLSPNTTALTLDGRQAEISELPFTVRLDSLGRQVIEMPVSLPSGAELGELLDPISGIEWRPGPPGSKSGSLFLPVTGKGGSLVLFLVEVQGIAQNIVGVISHVTLIVDSGTTSIELPLDGEAKILAELDHLPKVVAVNIRAIKASSPNLLALLEVAAGALQYRVAEVAYGLELEVKVDGAEARSLVGPATIIMSVASNWAEGWPDDAVRIARVSDSRQVAILDTIAIGSQAPGKASFQAASPEGFSTFVLIALATLPTNSNGGPASSSGLWLGIGLGSAAALALAGVLISLRFRARSSISRLLG